MYVSLGIVHVSIHAHGVQKRALDHLELQVVPSMSASPILCKSNTLLAAKPSL